MYVIYDCKRLNVYQFFSPLQLKTPSLFRNPFLHSGLIYLHSGLVGAYTPKSEEHNPPPWNNHIWIEVNMVSVNDHGNNKVIEDLALLVMHIPGLGHFANS